LGAVGEDFDEGKLAARRLPIRAGN